MCAGTSPPRFDRLRGANRAAGRLLNLIAKAGKFDVFLTVDKNLPHEQKTSGLPFAVVVLRARSNSITDVRPFAPEILRRLTGFQPGKVFILNQPH